MAKDHNERKEQSVLYCLSKVLKVVNEVRQFSALVHFLACRHHALRERPRPAAEHSYLADL